MEFITPEFAKELMRLNVSNRPLNQKTVNWYARQMKNNQWTVSGQTISISDKNTLIDGQHRLAAVILSGKTIQFNVAYNVPFESFVNYDSLRTRGVLDVFAIENVANYNRVSSIISKYNALCNNSISSAGFGTVIHEKSSGGGGVDKNKKMTNIEALKLYNSDKELFQEIAMFSQKCYKKIKLFSHSQVGGIIYYLIKDKKYKKEIVFSFFEQLFFNENVENMSIYNLREKLISGSVGNFQMLPRLKYVFLVKCWNAFVRGKEIKTYSFSQNETIPEFI